MVVCSHRMSSCSSNHNLPRLRGYVARKQLGWRKEESEISDGTVFSEDEIDDTRSEGQMNTTVRKYFGEEV